MGVASAGSKAGPCLAEVESFMGGRVVGRGPIKLRAFIMSQSGVLHPDSLLAHLLNQAVPWGHFDISRPPGLACLLSASQTGVTGPHEGFF